MIQLHGKYFRPLISAEEIQTAVKKVAVEIAADFKNEAPVFVGVLNGAFMFASDILRNYPHPCELCFVKLSSYQGLSSTGIVKTLLDVPETVQGKSVIILEDIIDTGRTLSELVDLFSRMSIKQFKIATMFYKPDAYKGEYSIDYVGISVPDIFIVGYGLDYNELGRNLPGIYQIDEQP